MAHTKVAITTIPPSFSLRVRHGGPLVALALCALLAACGGGSDGDNASPPAGASNPTAPADGASSPDAASQPAVKLHCAP